MVEGKIVRNSTNFSKHLQSNNSVPNSQIIKTEGRGGVGSDCKEISRVLVILCFLIWTVCMGGVHSNNSLDRYCYNLNTFLHVCYTLIF